MRRTRFPGVYSAGDQYWIRAKVQDPKTGRTRQVNRLVEAASASAAARMREEMRASKAGPEPTRHRLRDYAISWLANARNLKASTLDRYTTTIELHVFPVLGDHFLDAITHQDVVAWRDAQAGEPSSINARLRVLRGLIRSAVAELALPRDPTQGVKALRESSATDEDGDLLTGAELGALLEHVHERWRPLFALLAYTAMRVGEATALRWEDIDESANVIRVRRAQWRGQIDTTKTGAKRTVPLTAELASILREHRRVMVAEQTPGLASGWVFPARTVRKKRDDGVWPPVSTSSLRKPLRDALKTAELQGRITTHGLRRTWNNLLRQVAAGEVVRSITGHVTERMTEHYSHVHQNEKALAATRALSLVQRPASEVCTTVCTEAASEA